MKKFENAIDLEFLLTAARVNNHVIGNFFGSCNLEGYKLSINFKFCTAAPDAPLPKLSSRATSTAWR